MTGTQYYSLTDQDYVWTSLIDGSVCGDRLSVLFKYAFSSGAQSWCVCVWGGGLFACKDVVQNGTPTVHDTSLIFRCVSPPIHAGAIGPDFILDDNAHLDRAFVTNKYLETAKMV